ncbi:MAG: hypothetical protein R2941_23600, partial [Desulfobacterales bacterium]
MKKEIQILFVGLFSTLFIPLNSLYAFDIAEWFILTPGSEWHYTGTDVPYGAEGKDFTWKIPAEKKDMGNGIMATFIESVTDDVQDPTNHDGEYWYTDTEGNLYYCGFHKETTDQSMLAQDVIFDEPLLFGYKGLQIRDTVTATANGKIKTTFMGEMNTVFKSEITYLEIIPQVQTPLGMFKNVLRMRISINMTMYTVFGQPIEGTPATSEMWLKQGTGMILHDQDGGTEPDQAKNTAINRGRVGSTVIDP